MGLSKKFNQEDHVKALYFNVKSRTSGLKFQFRGNFVSFTHTNFLEVLGFDNKGVKIDPQSPVVEFTCIPFVGP